MNNRTKTSINCCLLSVANRAVFYVKRTSFSQYKRYRKRKTLTYCRIRSSINLQHSACKTRTAPCNLRTHCFFLHYHLTRYHLPNASAMTHLISPLSQAFPKTFKPLRHHPFTLPLLESEHSVRYEWKYACLTALFNHLGAVVLYYGKPLLSLFISHINKTLISSHRHRSSLNPILLSTTRVFLIL